MSWLAAIFCGSGADLHAASAKNYSKKVIVSKEQKQRIHNTTYVRLWRSQGTETQ